jgi:hypothetical protein
MFGPDATEKVAAEIGVSMSTLSLAQRHVTALERYPELEAPDISQREAVRRGVYPSPLCRASPQVPWGKTSRIGVMGETVR